MRCRGPHRILLVESWTPLGAHCICLSCRQTFHVETPNLEAFYIGFEHTSVDGPEEDMNIFIFHRELS